MYCVSPKGGASVCAQNEPTCLIEDTGFASHCTAGAIAGDIATATEAPAQQLFHRLALLGAPAKLWWAWKQACTADQGRGGLYPFRPELISGFYRCFSESPVGMEP